MLTTGSTRLAVNQGQQHSTIPYVTYSFLLCNSNLSLRRAIFTIFDGLTENAGPENGGPK